MPTHTIATGWAPEEVWGVDMISSNLRSLVWLRIVKVLQRERRGAWWDVGNKNIVASEF